MYTSKLTCISCDSVANFDIALNRLHRLIHSSQSAGCVKSKLSSARNFDIVSFELRFPLVYLYAAAACVRVGIQSMLDARC